MSDTESPNVLVHPVEHSSFIEGINYDPAENTMEVRIEREGSEVSYFYNKPQSTYERFIDADSYGRFFSKYIKNGDTSQYRNWDDDSKLVKENLRELLSESTETLCNTIAENDPEFIENNEDLIKSLRSRKDDSFVFDVDNDNVLHYTYHFRHLIIDSVIDRLVEKHSQDCDWIQDCIEMVEGLSREEKTVMVSSTI